jgi:aminoglycoside/choline kinase family phosphotransferase
MREANAKPPDCEALVRRVVREALGAEVVALDPIAGQLGRRRFLRVRLACERPASVIARIDAPEDPAGRPAGVEAEPPLEPLRSLLERHGLPVPRRYGGDPEAGVDLLEDLGSLSLAQAALAASPDQRLALYAQACDLVVRLQGLADPGAGVAAFRRRLDRAQFAYKAELFAAWSLRRQSRAATPAEVATVRDAFGRIAAGMARAPARLAHRDFQSANLLVTPAPLPATGEARPSGASAARIAMIDLQGAWLAPPEYDLVCLLRDSYLELPDDEVARHLEQVRPRLPDAPDPETFASRFDLLTLTRKAKDHARFLYAAETRGERGFLRYLPTTVRSLRAASARAARRDPQLAALAELIDGLPESPCAR